MSTEGGEQRPLSPLLEQLTKQQVQLIQKHVHLIQQQDTMIKLMQKIANESISDNIQSEEQQSDEQIPDSISDNIQSEEQQSDEQVPEEKRIRRLKLYRAALDGDWQVVKRNFVVHKDVILDEISTNGDTALHIATGAKRTDFVNELLKMLDEKDLARKNNGGHTALSLAAASGMVKLAREIMNRNKGMAMVKVGKPEILLPIEMAASLGHKDMVEYLYEETKDDIVKLDKEVLGRLLVVLINCGSYDVALELLTADPELATARNGNEEKGETALHALARKHILSSNYTGEKPGIFTRCLNLVSGAKDVKNEKLQARQLAERLWAKVVLLSDSKIQRLIESPRALIFDAAEQGNDQFLSVLIRKYPDLIRKVNNKKDNYTIFHFAVLNRHDNIFKFVYEIGHVKDSLALLTDEEDNNILHLAGKLAPSDRLNIVSGPTFQMQQELFWYQEVSGIVQPRLAEAKNKEGLTPRALFTKEHEVLRGKSEEWMKSTAESCMVVATLIATVVFAAAITVPGGNNGDTGLPFFLQRASFEIFVISDVTSLVSSTISIVTFLSILTSRYAEEDFLKRLPRKLLSGLAALLISISSLMVVFITTVFILFIQGTTWVAILVTIIASTPVIIFGYQKRRLFYDVFRYTFLKILPFEKGKIRLFSKEGETSDCQNAKQFNTYLTIPCTSSTNV